MPNTKNKQGENTHHQFDALIAAASKAQQAAYAPYSHFPVGAAVLTAQGCIFTGCNIENASFGLTVCAERVAIFKAVAEGQRRVTALAVVCSGDDHCRPCGACRQVLAEFADPQCPVLMVSQAGDYEVQTLADLLPLAFTEKAVKEKEI